MSGEPIIVTTTGQTSVAPQVISNETTTLQGMINIIADEIDDTSEEYITQIQRAVFAAIRFCSREVFYFNESREITIELENGKEFYSADDYPDLAKIIGMTHVFYEDIDGKKTLLKRVSPASQEADSETGEPRNYSYFDKKLRLSPVHGSGAIRIYSTPSVQDHILTADSANVWFSDAFYLIKARAKYTLYKDILKDMTMGAIAREDYNEELQALYVETSRRNGTGKIKANW